MGYEDVRTRGQRETEQYIKDIGGKRIHEMALYEMGFTVYWAVHNTPNGLFIHPMYVARPKQGGTANLQIARVEDGYVLNPNSDGAEDVRQGWLPHSAPAYFLPAFWFDADFMKSRMNVLPLVKLYRGE